MATNDLPEAKQSNVVSRPEPWKDLDPTDREGEQWRSVVNYDGLYEVSSHGRVKSVRRLDRLNRWRSGGIRMQECHAAAALKLSQEGVVTTVTVMHLVADAFLPAKPKGHVWYHRNKNPLDNRLDNITSGTWSTSSQVAYALGANPGYGTRGAEHQREVKERHYQQNGRWQQGRLVALRCTHCQEEKPLEEFLKAPGKPTTRRICRGCKLLKMGIQKPGFLLQHKELRQQGLRTCSLCRQTKPLATDFGRNARSACGYLHRCKPCHNAASRAGKIKQKTKPREPGSDSIANNIDTI